MPETFTDERVLQAGEGHIGPKPDDQSIEEYRRRLARHIEGKYQDFLEAWEIRTGRPWTTMTKAEALVLYTLHPSVAQLPGFQNILAKDR